MQEVALQPKQTSSLLFCVWKIKKFQASNQGSLNARILRSDSTILLNSVDFCYGLYGVRARQGGCEFPFHLPISSSVGIVILHPNV